MGAYLMYMQFDSVWKAKISWKIEIFLWLVRHNKIYKKVNLAKKGWLGNTSCVYSGQPENNDHILLLVPGLLLCGIE